MNHALWTGVSVGVIMALSVVTANAFTLTGKVSDDGGKAVRTRTKNRWLWRAGPRSDFSP